MTTGATTTTRAVPTSGRPATPTTTTPRRGGVRFDKGGPPAASSRVRVPRPGEPPDKAGAPTVTRAALTLGRATLSSTNRAARTVTRKVIKASKSDGAHESGLTALIWNQVLSYGTDAMVTVALAGTVFFGASADAKRGNVLLYLLITMAPFAARRAGHRPGRSTGSSTAGAGRWPAPPSAGRCSR